MAPYVPGSTRPKTNREVGIGEEFWMRGRRELFTSRETGDPTASTKKTGLLLKMGK